MNKDSKGDFLPLLVFPLFYVLYPPGDAVAICYHPQFFHFLKAA
jgi:hypothetical protein